MATIVKTPSGTWKAVIRKSGWPTTIKTFRTKRDAEDWARRTEDEMVRGVYIQRASSERLTVEAALKRYPQSLPAKRAAMGACTKGNAISRLLSARSHSGRRWKNPVDSRALPHKRGMPIH